MKWFCEIFIILFDDNLWYIKGFSVIYKRWVDVIKVDVWEDMIVKVIWF